MIILIDAITIFIAIIIDIIAWASTPEYIEVKSEVEPKLFLQPA